MARIKIVHTTPQLATAATVSRDQDMWRVVTELAIIVSLVTGDLAGKSSTWLVAPENSGKITNYKLAQILSKSTLVAPKVAF